MTKITDTLVLDKAKNGCIAVNDVVYEFFGFCSK